MCCAGVVSGCLDVLGLCCNCACNVAVGKDGVYMVAIWEGLNNLLDVESVMLLGKRGICGAVTLPEPIGSAIWSKDAFGLG